MGFLDKYASQILGITRIVVGLLFLEHGLMKLVGFPAAMGSGPLPPLTLVPQPHMHTKDMTVEIWGVARG